MIQLVEYDNFPNKKDFFDFCRNASKNKNDPASVNMWSENWYERPETVLYMLEIKKLFSGNNGKFFIATDNGKIVGCSGVYRSDFNSKIAIVGVRTWINKEYRNKLITWGHFFPAGKSWAINNNFDAVAITVNEYNKNLLKIFPRTRLGENKPQRKPHHLFYNNFNEINFPVHIKYTKQWIAYEILNPKFNFDWTTIMWNDQKLT